MSSSRFFHYLQQWLTLRLLLTSSLVLRVVLIAYGEWQDRNFAVKFTDIDYHVFSDAAKYVTEGTSPFLRPTYRYTPLLAILLTPNHYLFYSFGKLLFVVCDLMTGWLIYQILTQQGIKERQKLISCCLWLLNPLTAAVSSRGNAESLLAVLVLACLYFIMCKHLIVSAVLYGLAVHVKVFPIIYSLPLFLLLDENYEGKKSNSTSLLKRLMNRRRLTFALISALTFFFITSLLYFW